MVAVALLAWWVIPAFLFIGLPWLLAVMFWPGVGYQKAIELFLYNDFLHGNGLWFYLFIWSAVSAVIAFAVGSGSRNEEAASGAIFGFGNTLLCVLSLVLLVAFNINLDKDAAQYYVHSVTFYVKNPAHLPESLHLLGTDGASPGDGCAVLYHGTKNDSHGCVKQGDLPSDAWVPRIGSNDTAISALRNSSAVASGTSLDTDTVTYLNGTKSGEWSGVIDGSGLQNALGGVAEWPGHGTATVCTFTGDYAIDRAFHGDKSNSLTNLFHERFPMFTYHMTDVWGYCKDKQPIVVIPVTEPTPSSQRTVDTAAGVVIVRGDHGKTILDYHPDVKAGEFPGPVYPTSLTGTQRDNALWAAGRQNGQEDGGNHFGFKPTDDTDVQTGHVSEFLLEDQKTGRLQYVTPLTLRGSTSQLFVAFAISFGDEVHRGQLNPVSIYAFDDNDNRRVPIRNLVSAANNWLQQNQPWLKANGTTLKEFEPINGDTWRGYLENNNTVQYMLDVEWDGNTQSLAKTVLIPASGQPLPPPAAAPGMPPVSAVPGGPAPSTAFCGQPLDQLSTTQLQQCGNAVLGALAGRAK